MTTDERLDKFEKLVSGKPSNFLSKFEEYNKNKKWLDKSSEIAANILEALRDKNLSQKDLAERMQISAQQVNKIIKGQQNLTLETISKLEEALNISIVKTIDYKSANEIEVKSLTIKTGIHTEETIDTAILDKRNNNALLFTNKQIFMKVVYSGAHKEYLNVG